MSCLLFEWTSSVWPNHWQTDCPFFSSDTSSDWLLKAGTQMQIKKEAKHLWLTFCSSKIFLTRLIASSISLAGGRTWVLLAPNEKPPYLRREKKVKTWKRLEFVVSKIKTEENEKDWPEFIHPHFVFQTVKQKSRQLLDTSSCCTSVYHLQYFCVWPVLFLYICTVSPLADDLSVGFHQVVGDVSSCQVLKCITGTQHHLNKIFFQKTEDEAQITHAKAVEQLLNKPCLCLQKILN